MNTSAGFADQILGLNVDRLCPFGQLDHYRALLNRGFVLRCLFVIFSGLTTDKTWPRGRAMSAAVVGRE